MEERTPFEHMLHMQNQVTAATFCIYWFDIYVIHVGGIVYRTIIIAAASFGTDRIPIPII